MTKREVVIDQQTINLALRQARATVQRQGPESGTGAIPAGERRWAAMLGLAIFISLISQTATTQDEAVPGAGRDLTRAELRWCLSEKIRLEGESDELNQYEQWEVDRYNGAAQAFNKHCRNKMFSERDRQAVTAALTPEKRQALRQAGADRLIAARAEREARRFHVKDLPAVIRTLPGETGKELRQIPRWGELITTGKTQGRWYEVEWNEPSLGNVLRFGWVLGGLLERGSGKKARFEYCEEHAGRRAEHNEVVRGGTENIEARFLSVQNGTGKDAYIKLINEWGETSITFFVARELTAKVSGIPRGSYELAFATGELFSRGCDTFSEPTSASRFAERFMFDSDEEGWEVTLHSVTDGNTRAIGMNYDDFDQL